MTFRLASDNPVPIGAGSAFVLGQEQDVKGGMFEKRQSFSGRIAGFRVWSNPLTKEHLNQLATCGAVRFSYSLRMTHIWTLKFSFLSSLPAWSSGDELEWRIEGNGRDNFTDNWSYEAIQLAYIDEDELCKEDFWLHNVYLTKPLYFREAQRVCNVLGGTVSSMATNEEYENVYEQLKDLTTREIDQIQGKCLFVKEGVTIVRFFTGELIRHLELHSCFS